LRIRCEAEDFDNLQHTLSGVQTGQQIKHGLNKQEIDPVTGKKKEGSIVEAIQRTLDWLLLNDPVYRQVHENLMASIHSIQAATQSTLDRVTDKLANEYAVMDRLLAEAAKLPDGTIVFRGKDGNVRNEDGEIIRSELAASIQWSGNQPSYEEYLAQKQHIDQLEAYERELQGIETELGEIHSKANSNEDRYDKDELGSAQDRVDEIEKRIEEIDTDLDRYLDKKSSVNLTTNEETVELEKKEPTTLPPIKIGN